MKELLLSIVLCFAAQFCAAQQPQPGAPYYYQPARPAVVWVEEWKLGPFGIFYWRTLTPYPQPLQQQAAPQPLPQPAPPAQLGPTQ